MIKYEGNISYKDSVKGSLSARMFFGAVRFSLVLDEEISGGLFLFGNKCRDIRQMAEIPEPDDVEEVSLKERIKAFIRKRWQSIKEAANNYDPGESDSENNELSTRQILKKWWESGKERRVAKLKVMRAVLQIHDPNIRKRIIKPFKKIFKQLMPRVIKGTVVYGLDDPYYTAKVLEIFVLLYAKMGDDLKVTPVWDCFKLECDTYCYGRIGIVTVVWNTVKLIVTPEFRKIWREYNGK